MCQPGRYGLPSHLYCLFREPRPTLASGLSASIAAPLMWNALPIYVHQSDSLAIFKSRLKTALSTTAFDSLDVT